MGKRLIFFIVWSVWTFSSPGENPHQKNQHSLCYHDFFNDLKILSEVKTKNYDQQEYQKLYQITRCFNKLELNEITIDLLSGPNGNLLINPKIPKYSGLLFYNIGQAQSALNHQKKAEIYYEKAIKIFIRIRDDEEAVKTSMELAEQSLMANDVEKSLLYLNLSKSLIKKLPENTKHYYSCKVQLFESKLLMNNHETNRINPLIDSVISLIPRLKTSYQQDCLLHLSDVLLSARQFGKAGTYLLSLKENDLNNKKYYYLLLSDYYRLIRNESLYQIYQKKYLQEVEKEKDLILSERAQLLAEPAFTSLVKKIQKRKEGVKVWDILMIGIVIFSTTILLIILFIIFTQKKKLSLQKKELKTLYEKKERLKKQIEQLEKKSHQGQLVKKHKHNLMIKKELDENIRLIKELQDKIKQNKRLLDSRNKNLLQINFYIRSYLSNILALSNLLKTGFAQKGASKLYQYTDNIENSANNFLNIIEIFSNYISLVYRKPNLNEEDILVNRIIQVVLEDKSHIIKNKKIKIVYNAQKQVYVKTDYQLLNKIIKIALNVAIHNTENGFVNIQINHDEHSGLLKIKILNTGHGFAKAYLKDILEPYSREGLNYIPGFHGTGMEFPLLKRLTEILKGKYEVQSDYGKGITQEIEIKVKKSNLTPTNTRTGQEVIPWENKKVLVVEDDKMNRLLFERILTGTDETKIVPGEEQALQAVKNLYINRQTYDFVLMDIRLAEHENGVDVMKKIRRTYPEYEEIPFIAQTAYAMQGDREKFLNEGFDEYIAKPILRHMLIRVIKKALDLSQKVE